MGAPHILKALFFDGTLACREVEMPPRGEGEALIQVALAGICGTDREILKGYFGFRGIPGHEFVGRVVDCEEKAWLGRRVVGEINVACGRCSWCARGMGRHCPQRTVMGIAGRNGSFAEFLTLPLGNLHQVPDEVSDESAVFVEPLAAATEILDQMRIEPGTRVAALGDGRLGLLVVQVLRHARADVTVIGRHNWKLDLARAWGAEVRNADDGAFGPASFPVVVDTTGSPRGIEEALRLVEPRGTVVMKSTFHGTAHFDATKLVVDEVTLLGSRCGDFAKALDLLRRGSVSVQQMVSKIFPLESGREAFEYLDGTSCLKALFAIHPG